MQTSFHHQRPNCCFMSVWFSVAHSHCGHPGWGVIFRHRFKCVETAYKYTAPSLRDTAAPKLWLFEPSPPPFIGAWTIRTNLRPIAGVGFVRMLGVPGPTTTRKPSDLKHGPLAWCRVPTYCATVTDFESAAKGGGAVSDEAPPPAPGPEEVGPALLVLSAGSRLHGWLLSYGCAHQISLLQHPACVGDKS